MSAVVVDSINSVFSISTRSGRRASSVTPASGDGAAAADRLTHTLPTVSVVLYSLPAQMTDQTLYIFCPVQSSKFPITFHPSITPLIENVKPEVKLI